MRTLVGWKNDLVQITRDPILLVLMFAPILMILVFKLLFSVALPYVENTIGIHATPYFPYILSFTLLMIPSLLGIVTGFMMLDDKDGKIAELLSVTPMGRNGYLVNRLSLGSLLSLLYGYIGYFTLHVWAIPLGTLILLSLMLALYAATFSLLLFGSAEDKVKGLTFAKGLNLINLFAFTDLFGLPWMTMLSWLFPSYWFNRVIHDPDSMHAVAMLLLTNGIWLGLLVVGFKKRSQ